MLLIIKISDVGTGRRKICDAGDLEDLRHQTPRKEIKMYR
jgi:hypothetical protein